MKLKINSKVKSDFYDEGVGWVRQKVIFDDEGVKHYGLPSYPENGNFVANALIGDLSTVNVWP